MTEPVQVQLLRVPDCPLAQQVRDLLDDCLAHAPRPVRVEELVGTYPSPTLLVAGVDVVTGNPPGAVACCRLDLPTRQQILAALHGRG